MLTPIYLSPSYTSSFLSTPSSSYSSCVSPKPVMALPWRVVQSPEVTFLKKTREMAQPLTRSRNPNTVILKKIKERKSMRLVNTEGLGVGKECN